MTDQLPSECQVFFEFLMDMSARIHGSHHVVSFAIWMSMCMSARLDELGQNALPDRAIIVETPI